MYGKPYKTTQFNNNINNNKELKINDKCRDIDYNKDNNVKDVLLFDKNYYIYVRSYCNNFHTNIIEKVLWKCLFKENLKEKKYIFSLNVKCKNRFT